MADIDMSDLGAPLEQQAIATPTSPKSPATVDTSDLGPADSVLNTPQTVFDEVRGRTYEIPAGMAGHEADHAIGTQQDNRSRADYFGFIDLGKDFGKGLLSHAFDLAEIPAQYLISQGEMSKGALTRGGVAEGPVFGAEPAPEGAPKSVADMQIMMGRALSRTVEGYKSSLDLTPSNPESGFSKLAFAVGSGATDILTSIGLAAIAANSAPAAILTLAYFGAQNAAQGYKKARAFGRGKSPAESMSIALGEGSLTAAVNGIGLKYLSAGIRMGSGFNRIGAMILEQSAEEFIDQGSQDIYENLTDLQKKSAQDILKDAVFSAMVGAIVSAPASGVVHAHIKSQYTKALTDLGIPEEKATSFLDIQTEKTLASPDFHKAAVQLAVDQTSEQAIPSAERLANLQQVDKWHNELAAQMDVDLQAIMGAEAMNQKISEEMGRIEESVQAKIDKVVNFTDDLQLKGMELEAAKNKADKIKEESKKLLAASDAILAKIDELEAQKSELEAQSKVTTAVDKKIVKLIEKHDALDAQLGDLLNTPSGLKDRAKRQQRLSRINRLAKRADAIVKEIDALEEGQNAVRSLQEKTNVKATVDIEKRLNDLRQQYDNIDEELAGLIHDEKSIAIPESSFVRLPAKSMDAITARLGKVMEATRAKLVEAYSKVESSVDKSYEKLANRVATLARVAEKKRIHEALKILRQIKTADIEDITIKERRAILEIQKELNDIKGSPTLKQLHDINNRIQLIKEQGKARLNSIKEARKNLFDAQKQALLLALKVEGQGKKEGEVHTGRAKEKTLQERKQELLTAERIMTLSPVRLFEMLDGNNDNGIFKELFFKAPNRAMNQRLLAEQEALARMQEINKKYGITLEEASSKLNAEGVDGLTIQDAMVVYMSLGNDLQLLAMIKDNGLSRAQIEAVVAALPQKYKDAAQEYVAEVSTHAPRLNVALLDYSDGKKDLKLEGPNYWPLFRYNPGTENFNIQEQIDSEYSTRFEFRQRAVEKGMTEERVNRGENVTLNPVRLAMFETYLRHTHAREHFIALGRIVKDLNALLADKEVVKAINDAHGDLMVKALQDYVNILATDSVAKAHNAMSVSNRIVNDLAREGRKAAAFVHLGWNLISVAKVPVSLASVLGRVSPVHVMASLSDIMADQKKVYDFAHSRDPQLEAAEWSKEQQELRDPLKAMKNKTPLGKYKNNAFDWMRALDQWTRVVTWMAAYKQAKMPELNMSEKEAVEFAQETVLRTQPATMPKDLASIFATNNEVLNLVQQFTHQVNQNYGILTHDLPRAWKGGRQEQAMGMAVGLVIMMILEYAISTGSMPVEPDDWTEALIQGSLYMAPVVGPMLNAAHNGFNTTAAGADLFFGKGYKLGQEAFKLSQGEGNFAKVLDNALYFGSAFGKLPYTQLRRTLIGAYDLSTGVTDDFRRLVWSNYQLSRNEE